MNHLADTNKMVETPRTDEQINGKPCTRFEVIAGDSLRNASVPSEFTRQLERELNAASKQRDDALMMLGMYRMKSDDQKQRIKRLEKAGDALANHHLLVVTTYDKAKTHVSDWNKAKEAKP